MGTYDSVAFKAELVKIFELGLTLVELVEVCLVKRNPRVGFVHLHAKVVLDPLHGHVLSQRPELVVDVDVVRAFVLPLALQEFQGLLQHGLRTHLGGVWRTCESEIVLFHSGARASDSHVSSLLIQIHLSELGRLFWLRLCRLRTDEFGFHFGLERLLEFKLLEAL